MKKLSLFRGLALAAVLAAGACDKHKNNNHDGATTDGTEPGFALSMPEDRWAASKYCGDVVPATPEDPAPEYHFEKSFLQEKLAGAGLTGWIHGAVPMYKQFVFTYRKEDGGKFDILTAEQFSLVPATSAIADTLATLKRHDQIRLKGDIFENGSPLVHIMVTGIELLNKYPHSTENAYEVDATTFGGLKTFELFGQVHATVASETLGRAIVVERGNLILPIAINPKHDLQAAPLYHGDIINIHVKVVEHPHGPPHLETDDAADQAITVVDPMLNCHGQARTVEGYLVKYEESPAISTDVYAVRVIDANGIARNFTLFPAANPQTATDDFVELFAGLSAKAKAAWDSSPAAPVVIRNFSGKESVKVKVTGVLNVVSVEQANAQVYVTNVDDLTFPE